MLRIALASVILVGLHAPTLRAQTPADSARRPFVEGGTDDKPYLTHLFGRTAIGGYAEMHARWQRADGVREERGFQLKRWNIFTSTEVSDFVRIGSELEFEEMGDEITIEFAAIDFIIHPSLTLRGGAILAPIGRFNLSHDSPRNEFTDRPLVSTDIIGTALTEIGLGALGLVGLGGSNRITYELYAVNGFHQGVIDDASGGTRIPFGKRNAEDNNGSPAFVGRVAWSPTLGHEVGVSAHHGAYNSFELDGEIIDDRRDITIRALDLETSLLGVDVSGEAVWADIGIPAGLRGIYAGAQRGAYLQAVRALGNGWIPTMPASYFEVGVRMDAVDFDRDLGGDSVHQMTLGVNFRPTADAALKLDFVRGRSADRFNNRGDHAGVVFSMATYF